MFVVALAAPAPALAATGDLAYVDCIANRGANDCEQAAHNSLGRAAAVEVSRDGKSVYVASDGAITWFKRRRSGALAYGGCIANGGAHGCKKARHQSLDLPFDLAVSPDSRSVYVVALESNAITRFARRSNGALAYKGCFANRGRHGCKDPPGNSLGDAAAVAVSPDGKSVYVASAGHPAFPRRGSQGGNSITRFARHPNGAIGYRGCIANHGDHGCGKPVHDSLYGSLGVTVSPDGKSVYVASTTGITTFARHRHGALAYRSCIANQGHHGCAVAARDSLRKSRDIAVTADGESLYVASSGAITWLGRAANGQLTYEGCMANRGESGCQAPVHDSLRFPNDLALSRDGESVYVASLIGSITELERASDGALTFGTCFANEGARGCELPLHDSLGYARGVTVSRDGRSVYVAAYNGNSITQFSREIATP